MSANAQSLRQARAYADKVSIICEQSMERAGGALHPSLAERPVPLQRAMVTCELLKARADLRAAARARGEWWL